VVMTEKLDAIFFDIDDTLFSTSVFAEKARRNAIDAMINTGLRASREECIRELQEVIAEFTSNHDQHLDKLISRLPERASAGMNPAILVAAGVVAYHETKYRELKVYDDVYEVLKSLADTSIIRGVISAGLTLKQAEKIVRLHIYEYLTPKAIFFTDQIGTGKPNPKLYERCLQTLDLEPSRCIYVGDNPTNDIDPCNKVGMITVRNRRSGRFSRVQGQSEPDHEIRDFYDLRAILREEFSIPI
jgi:putative hydrolase of the HAD superfamily